MYLSFFSSNRMFTKNKLPASAMKASGETPFFQAKIANNNKSNLY